MWTGTSSSTASKIYAAVQRHPRRRYSRLVKSLAMSESILSSRSRVSQGDRRHGCGIGRARMGVERRAGDHRVAGRTSAGVAGPASRRSRRRLGRRVEPQRSPGAHAGGLVLRRVVQEARRLIGPHALDTSDFTARQALEGLEAGSEVFVRVSFQSLDNARATSEPVLGRLIVPPRPAGRP